QRRDGRHDGLVLALVSEAAPGRRRLEGPPVADRRAAISFGVRRSCAGRAASPCTLRSWVHTYYDNLKVAQDAPPAVIRAAYRALAQQYHPDRNPGSAEAARVMKLVNEAYAVLSDPERRRAHDDWIRSMEVQTRSKSQDAAPAAHAAEPER